MAKVGCSHTWPCTCRRPVVLEGETLQRSASVRVQPGQSRETFSLRIALSGLPRGASRFRRLGLDLDLTFAATADLHLNPARLGSLSDRERQMQDPVGIPRLD